MKIKAELFGTKIGVDDNLTEALKTKKLGVLLQMYGENNQSKIEVILNKSDVESLIQQLMNALHQADEEGFEVAEVL